MSTHFTMPSPSAKAGTSTKRPYESNTPSALGTPKDTSGQSMRSPGQAASKKAKVGEDGATNPPKELSKGGQWMVAKLDELERLYKEVLLAATAVIQYQTYTLKLGKEVRRIPVHLERRVKIAWGNFEATRRHVQAYMLEAAQEAATPSKRDAPMSIPLPPPSASLSVSDLPTNLPFASPIPLSAATMLSFQPDQAAIPPDAAIPKYESGIQAPPPPIVDNFQFDMLSTLPGNNAGGMGNLDISNINMGDLAGLMGTSGFDFTTLSQQTNNQPQAPSNQGPSQGQSQIQPQTQPQSQAAQKPVMLNTNPGATGQSDTDRLLAQLGELSGATGGDITANVNEIQANVISDEDVNALLASLGDTSDAIPDFTNFDFGDMDLSNLGDMSGLFNTSTAPTEVNVADTGISQPQPTSIPLLAEQNKSNATEQQVILNPNQDPNNTTAAPPPASTDAVDPNLDLTNVFDETQPIDLDDFNFGDGDQAGEGGVGISGDEFESLLAAFN